MCAPSELNFRLKNFPMAEKRKKVGFSCTLRLFSVPILSSQLCVPSWRLADCDATRTRKRHRRKQCKMIQRVLIKIIWGEQHYNGVINEISMRDFAKSTWAVSIEFTLRNWPTSSHTRHNTTFLLHHPEQTVWEELHELFGRKKCDLVWPTTHTHHIVCDVYASTEKKKLEV